MNGRGTTRTRSAMARAKSAQRAGSSSSRTASSSRTGANTNRPRPNEQRPPSRNRVTRSNNAEPRRRILRDDEGPRRVRVINVGERYQVPVPNASAVRPKPSESPERETCVWSTKTDINDDKIREFCEQVHEKLGLKTERALYQLYRNDFNFNVAMSAAIQSAKLADDDWTENDKYCFHGLFSTYGRDFRKIHQIMSHKSMRQIIEYYYRVKLKNNYASMVDNDTIGFELNRKNSIDDRDPDIMRPSVCQNCGTRALLYHINNKMQCLSCRKYFEEFNSNRRVDNSQEKALSLKYADEVISMVRSFKDMCEPQSTGKSRCEETKQNTIYSCRLLRSEALRKEVNAGKVAQKVLNEVSLDDYRKLLTAGNASSARLRVTNIWTNNEKNVAVQALIRYGGNREATAAILGTKTPEMVNEFYSKYEQVLNEAIIKPKTEQVSRRRQKADQKYKTMLNELEKNVEVVDLD